MGVAVELYFDEAGQQRIRDLMARLTERGIPPVLDQLDVRPHVSLAVFPSADLGAVAAVVKEFAPSSKTLPLTFSHIGAFPTTEGVVFLAPIFSERLRRLHQTFHSSLAAAGLVSGAYYAPDRWVPHCTLTTDIDGTQMSQAVHTLVETFKPFEVQCRSIGVVSFRPVSLHSRYELARS